MVLLFMPPALMFIYSILLWVFAPKISTKLGVDNNEFTLKSNTPSLDFETLVFLTIGLILIVQSLPIFSNLIAYNAIVDKNILPDADIEHLRANSIAYMIENSIKIIIGILFILKAKKLGNFLKNFYQE